MPNQLANETSPYLLQHADNPVEWYPWGAEALEKARREDKPILLSIGYAACHWCHVMAHESFEDPATAALMNQHFVNVKVDREERPDLDSIYMNAVVALTGQGGWPMTVFLTPDGKPFYGGTYFPPVQRYGMPSFMQLLQSIGNAWQTQREKISESASEIADHLGRSLTLAAGAGDLSRGILEQAVQNLAKAYDRQDGGWGQAPKFPQAMTIEFLLRMVHEQKREDAQQMVEQTLQQMAWGGMYDQIGGGFARYSTDKRWLVPHFEKMLYDNALLARAYLHAWQLTGRDLYRRIVEETLDWVLREMRSDQGGFYSSMDADSEGEEGKFYVWQKSEIEAALTADQAELLISYYNVRKGGNWEGKSILHVTSELADVAGELGLGVEEAQELLSEARQRLYEKRAQRVWPGKDDKVLTAWNGLMMAAFAEAGRVLKRKDYVDAARENAEFLYDTMRRDDERLWRTWREGSKAHYNAYLEDYAYLIDGLLALYQTVFDPRWFHWARGLTSVIVEHFRDPYDGGFFDTSDDHEQLIQRPKDVQDNAVPSGNAMAAQGLVLVSLFTGDGDLWSLAEESVAAMTGAMAQYPTGFAQWLNVAALMLGDPREVAIIGDPGEDDTQQLLDAIQADFRPYLVVAAGHSEDNVPLLANRPRLEERATAYVCRRFVCRQPVARPEALAEQLAE